MNGDDDLIPGVDRQAVCVLLDTVEKQRHVGIVPGDRLIQLHQQKLVVDARIRAVNDTFGNVDAGVASLRAFEEDVAKLAQPIEEAPTTKPRLIRGPDLLDKRIVVHLAPPLFLGLYNSFSLLVKSQTSETCMLNVRSRL